MKGDQPPIAYGVTIQGQGNRLASLYFAQVKLSIQIKYSNFIFYFLPVIRYLCELSRSNLNPSPIQQVNNATFELLNKKLEPSEEIRDATNSTLKE